MSKSRNQPVILLYVLTDITPFSIIADSLIYATNSLRNVLVPMSSATSLQSSHSVPIIKATGMNKYEQIHYIKRKERKTCYNKNSLHDASS